MLFRGKGTPTQDKIPSLSGRPSSSSLRSLSRLARHSNLHFSVPLSRYPTRFHYDTNTNLPNCLFAPSTLIHGPFPCSFARPFNTDSDRRPLRFSLFQTLSDAFAEQTEPIEPRCIHHIVTRQSAELKTHLDSTLSISLWAEPRIESFPHFTIFRLPRQQRHVVVEETRQS